MTNNPDASLLDLPLPADFSITSLPPVAPKLEARATAGDGVHVIVSDGAAAAAPAGPLPEGQTCDGVPLDVRFVTEARAFWLRFRANGGPGVDANHLALLLQNSLKAETAQVAILQAALKTADANGTELNVQLINLRSQLFDAKHRDVKPACSEAEYVVLPKKRGRKPKAAPAVVAPPAVSFGSVDSILSNSL